MVYETETHKGGGTFAEICQLCPEGKREAFFNGARAVLPFSRLFEFQRVLLCQLLSHMLLATPRYADDAMPETAEHTLMSLASSLSPRKASKSLAQLSSQLSSHGLGCCAASGSAESGAADEAGAAEAAVIEVAVIGPQRDWLRAAEVTIYSSEVAISSNEVAISSSEVSHGCSAELSSELSMDGAAGPGAAGSPGKRSRRRRSSFSSIAEVLKRTAGFGSNKGLHAVELFTRDSIVAQPRQLGKPIKLLYSTANPGAAEVAAAMAALLGSEYVQHSALPPPQVGKDDSARWKRSRADSATPGTPPGASSDASPGKLSKSIKKVVALRGIVNAMSRQSMMDGMAGAMAGAAGAVTEAASSMTEAASSVRGAVTEAASSMTEAASSVTEAASQILRDMSTKKPIFLLVLNAYTWRGALERSLTRQILEMLHLGIRIVSVHHIVLPFQAFIDRTPHDLLSKGLFTELAIPLFPPGPLQATSLLCLAAQLGATKAPGSRPLSSVSTDGLQSHAFAAFDEDVLASFEAKLYDPGLAGGPEGAQDGAQDGAHQRSRRARRRRRHPHSVPLDPSLGTSARRTRRRPHRCQCSLFPRRAGAVPLVAQVVLVAAPPPPPPPMLPAP